MPVRNATTGWRSLPTPAGPPRLTSNAFTKPNSRRGESGGWLRRAQARTIVQRTSMRRI